MSKMIQIRNVPDYIHGRLKARSALSGLSLSEYLLREITRSAEAPSEEELWARLRSRKSVEPGVPPALMVREEIDGEPVLGIQGNVLFATMDLEYQHAIKNWLAVRARVKLNARLGSDVQSLLVAGVNATTGYQLGWLVKVAETDRLMLAANADVSNNTTTAIVINDFIEDIIDGVAPRLVQTTPSVRGNAGLRLAYGVSPLFGFTVFASGGYGESIDRRAASEWFFTGGGSVDFDIRPKTGVPLGLLLGYSFESFPEADDDFAGESSRGVVRIEYTGRSDLGLGIGITGDRVGTETFGTLSIGSAGLDLRYFF